MIRGAIRLAAVLAAEKCGWLTLVDESLVATYFQHLMVSAQGSRRTDDQLAPKGFEGVAVLLPRRFWEEELGDALEVLYALRTSGAPGWKIHLKTFSTIAWLLVNALREIMSAVTGQAREREK